MSEAQWAQFVAHRQSEEFQERSKKAKERQECNMHPHFLGSAGYVGKRSEWMIADPLSSQSSCASVSSSLLSSDRSFDWVRARLKKSEEGSYYIPNEKTEEVFHKIIEKCDEVSQGTFQSNRYDDILTSALGTSEKKRGHGTVRGIGSYSSIRQVFGKPEQKQHTSGGVTPTPEVKKLLEQCRQATLLEVQPKIDMLTQQLNILMKNMSTSSQCPQGVSADTPQSVFAPCDIPPTRSSCHSVDAYPVTTIKSKKKCYLAQCGLEGKMFVVAQGTAYPTTAETTIVHNQPVLPNHVKVMVDEVVIGAEDCPLPVPVLQYKTLNDVVGTYTQWPIHLVLLDEANVKIRSPRQNKPIKDPSVYLSAAATRRLGPIVGENVFMLLGKNGKRLVKTLTSFPGDKEYLDVDLDPTVFHHGNVNGVFVMLEDIKDLLTMNWLDLSVIQVFMMFLNSLCKQYGVASIGFACPTQISVDMVNKNPETVTSYLIHVMDTHKDQQFILAPYHQENHWLLIVICINLKTVYVLIL